jgi:hypothetical protein
LPGSDLNKQHMSIILKNMIINPLNLNNHGTLTPQFNAWLEDKSYEIFETEKDSFKNSFNSTGVQVKIIVINK